MHQQHAADTLFAVLRGIDDAGPAGERAGIDAAEGDGADEGIVHDLEGKKRHRLLVVGLADDLVALVVQALDGRNVQGAWQIIDDRVEQRLNALVFERRTAQHRKERSGEDGLANKLFECRLLRLFAFEVSGHGGVIEFDRSFDHLLAVVFSIVEHVGRNVDVVVIGAERFVVPNNALHADQVDKTFKVLLGADGKLDSYWLCAEARLDVVETLKEVGADLVHLVREDNARNLVLVTLTPDRLGLRLYTLVGIENAYGAVEHAQRTLHLNSEVDVPRRIDDIETLFFPESGRRGRRDGNAALLLLLHPIHRRGAFVDLADLVAFSRVIEDPLSRRRLSGIDVRHDAEVAVVLDGVAAGHRGSVLEAFLLLPAIMREGTVGFRHLVRVFALLDCVSPIIGCIEQLT